MIEIPGRIPLAIHPYFWLFAGIIGWINSQSFFGALLWVGIIFVSVLVHEFGHALTAVLFKQKARIQLVALGGLTLFEGPKLPFWKQFLITLNGPLFGFFLFLLATLLLQWTQWTPLFAGILKATQIANLFWTVVNLLPVLPLDGGQLLRIVLEALFGIRGFRAALLIGAIVAALFALTFFMIQQILMGAFFFLFAFQSFESWRKSRFATRNDRDDQVKQLMMQAEMALQEERSEEAKRLLEEVREKGKGGLLAITAAQYLAFLALKEKKRKEAYDLLLPIKDHLADDALSALHELAAGEKNWPLVAELSTECYQIMENQKTALNNARAFAHQGQAKLAGGWLQTAWQSGGLDLRSVLQEEEFQKLKENPEFQEFVEPLQ